MIQALIPLLGGVLDKVLPDQKASDEAKLKVMDLMQKGELAALDADVRLALGQMEINKAEAGTDLFRGGWRPAVGWTCVAGLSYNFVLQPVLPWLVRVAGSEVPDMPTIDNDTLMMLLTGMLGLGGLRTFERVKGKA